MSSPLGGDGWGSWQVGFLGDGSRKPGQQCLWEGRFLASVRRAATALPLPASPLQTQLLQANLHHPPLRPFLVVSGRGCLALSFIHILHPFASRAARPRPPVVPHVGRTGAPTGAGICPRQMGLSLGGPWSRSRGSGDLGFPLL